MTNVANLANAADVAGVADAPGVADAAGLANPANVAVRNLTIRLGANTVIENLDLDVRAGEFVVLLGPSGCGKSTLLHSIAGLIDVSDGSIEIAGEDMTWADPKDRRIALVFQSYALYPTMSVERNLSFALRINGTPKAEIARRVTRASEMLQLGAAAQAQTGATIGRPTPARGDRPRDRARSRRVPVRRTAVESRRQIAHRAAPRTQATASASRRNDDLRDARSGRSDDARHPHGGDARRRDPAVRHARRGLRAARQSVRRDLPRFARDESAQGHARDARRRAALSHRTHGSSTCRPMRSKARRRKGSRACSAYVPKTCGSARGSPSIAKVSLVEPMGNHRVVWLDYHGGQIASIDQSKTPVAVGDDRGVLVRRRACLAVRRSRRRAAVAPRTASLKSTWL